MKKKLGHYIAGLSVVAVLGGGAKAYGAFEKQDNDDNKDKIEYSQNSLRDSLKEDCKDAYECFSDFLSKVGNELYVRNLNCRENLRTMFKKDFSFSYEMIEELGKAPRIKNLAYQNDTLNADDKNISDAYYRSGYNTITDNIKDGVVQNYVETFTSLAHEVEHMHQYSKVNFSADMNFRQHYKLHDYMEIGATVAGLLQARQMYKEAKTDEERKEIIEEGKIRYSYYFDKVESGEINPLSTSVSDFDEEMKFIINETDRYWGDNIAYMYKQMHEEDVLFDIQKGTGSVETNDENYLKARDEMLNIAGIKFGDLLSEKSNLNSVSSNMFEADYLIKSGAKVDNVLDALKKDGLSNEADVFLANVNNFELRHFSYEQKYNLAVNYYFASIVKGIEDLVTVKEFETSLPHICELDSIYQKTSELVEQLCIGERWSVKASDKEYKEQIRKIWSYKDANGNEACFLDKLGVDEPDFSQYIASSEKLKLKDAYGFSNYMSDYFSLYKKDSKKEKVVGNYKIGNEYRVEVDDVAPAATPKYWLEKGKRRSKTLYTNEIIDTRSDFLAKERQKRVEMEKIHGKTEEGSQTAKQTDSKPIREIHVNDLIKMLER